MRKECFQIVEGKQTSCFKTAGGTPCSASTCAVAERIQELISHGTKVDDWFLNILPHSTCRLSRLSPDNSEFWQRYNALRE